VTTTQRRRLATERQRGRRWWQVGLFLLLYCGCEESAAPPPARYATPSESLSARIEQPAPLQSADSPPAPLPEGDAAAVAQAETIGRVFRPSDIRPQHDDRRAAELGIERYESRHLLLYTDIDPDIAATLPSLMDQAYAALTKYFGELPPNREGTDFQLTGYIMQDRDRFLAAGMLPEEALQSLVHGIHRGAEFWMYEQEYEYYRRHLMVHEGTHCFMLTMPGPRPPVWYLEGMAEFFGTHRLDEAGRAQFGVMPGRREDFIGFGRIEMIHQAIADDRPLTVDGVRALTDNDFTESRTEPYAWSWALCKFLDAHPRYQARFRELGQHLTDRRFSDVARAAYAVDRAELFAEWALFTRNLEYGHEIALSAIEFVSGEPLPARGSIAIDVDAAGGWQSSGVGVVDGSRYTIQTSGEVVLADDPKPWISEPDGVSIRYAHGRPIGRLLAAVVREPLDSDWTTIDIGGAAEVTPKESGTLYFRINDAWSDLSNNDGSYRVTIERNDAR